MQGVDNNNAGLQTYIKTYTNLTEIKKVSRTLRKNFRTEKKCWMMKIFS